MNRETDNLQAALRTLAAGSAGASAPDRVRRALQAELRGRRRRRLLAAWWPAAAAAAALIVGIWLGRPQAPQAPVEAPSVAAVEPAPAEIPAAPSPAQQPAPSESAPQARLVTAATPASSAAVTPWFLYTGVPPAARGQVVRIRVSAATAAQFGVYRGAGDVPAQVFIGDDGPARAIRFVR